MYIDEAKHFLACIRGETAPACDGWDGLKTMRVIDAAIKASAERRWVQV
jgi:predicted dehydrogenase